jgi:hypothetical protein
MRLLGWDIAANADCLAAACDASSDERLFADADLRDLHVAVAAGHPPPRGCTGAGVEEGRRW